MSATNHNFTPNMVESADHPGIQGTSMAAVTSPAGGGGDVYLEDSFNEFYQLCLANIEEKISVMKAKFTAASRTVHGVSTREFKTNMMYIENYSMQTFRDKISEQFKETDMDECQDVVPAGNAHRLALQECHVDLVNGLDLNGTLLLDDLVAQHLMEESEMKSITGKGSKKAVTEAFLRRMQVGLTVETFVKRFLPVLSRYNPDEARTLSTAIKRFGCMSTISECYTCQIKAFVEPHLLADVLYANGFVSSNMHHALRGEHISNEEKWNMLTEKVADHRCVLEALRVCCPAVYQEFDLGNAQSFDCRCRLLSTQPKVLCSPDMSPDGTVSDVGNVDDLESILDPEDFGYGRVFDDAQSMTSGDEIQHQNKSISSGQTHRPSLSVELYPAYRRIFTRDRKRYDRLSPVNRYMLSRRNSPKLPSSNYWDSEGNVPVG